MPEEKPGGLWGRVRFDQVRQRELRHRLQHRRKAGASRRNRDRTTGRVLKPHSDRLPGGIILPMRGKGVASPAGNPVAQDRSCWPWAGRALGPRPVKMRAWRYGRGDGPCHFSGETAFAPCPGGIRKRSAFPRPRGTLPPRPVQPAPTEASIRVRQGFCTGLVSCHSRPSRRSVLAGRRRLRIAATRASLGVFRRCAGG